MPDKSFASKPPEIERIPTGPLLKEIALSNVQYSLDFSCAILF